MNITIVAGARPNFMKIAPIIRSIRKARSAGYEINYRLVHTGQHYDQKMSGDFFNQLGLPFPDINLECGNGSQGEQTASIMRNFEKELELNKPDLVLVVGDVNSTMACAITAKKMNLDTAHVEAGIRSGDMKMPEEINRLVTDSICDLYFTTSRKASENLLLQHIDQDKIHFVGNTMIDTLIQHIDNIKKPDCWDSLNLRSGNYMVLTLHRPSNVDDPIKLKDIIETIMTTSGIQDIVFPIHPRTMRSMQLINMSQKNLKLIGPQAYHEFIYLIKHAKCIITDSGGITEEATFLDIPCITLRDTTERPETVEMGTNELAGDDPTRLKLLITKIMDNNWKKGSIPERWDGRTSDRIVDILLHKYAIKKNEKVSLTSNYQEI